MSEYNPYFTVGDVNVLKQRLRCWICGDDFMEMTKNKVMKRIHPDGREVGRCSKFMIELDKL